MNEINPTTMAEQQSLVNENNIVQNYLGIKMIEIEQLNPRINQLNGVMKVKYHGTGDVDGGEAVNYDYEWVGGEIVFVQNPFMRVPMGTGKVAFIHDDSQDPVFSNRIKVPEGALSGEEYGWNRELLASHYGDCYWRIVDEEIDLEIRERYRNILKNFYLNAGEDEQTADAKAHDGVKKAVEIQQSRNVTGQRVTVRAITPAQMSERVISEKPTKAMEDNEMIRSQQAEIAELKRQLGEVISEKNKKKPLTEKQLEARRQTALKMVAAKKKKREAELAAAKAEGNLGG